MVARLWKYPLQHSTCLSFELFETHISSNAMQTGPAGFRLGFTEWTSSLSIRLKLEIHSTHQSLRVTPNKSTMIQTKGWPNKGKEIKKCEMIKGKEIRKDVKIKGVR